MPRRNGKCSSEKDTAEDVSRVLYLMLLTPQQTPVIYLALRSPARSSATYPPTSDEQPLIVGIHGLATRGTYGRMTSLPPRWALTPPFHPYRPTAQAAAGGYFLLRSHNLTAVKSLACAVLCVARTFLPRTEPAATRRTCGTKIGNSRVKNTFPAGISLRAAVFQYPAAFGGAVRGCA